MEFNNLAPQSILMKLKTIEDIPSDWKRLTVRKKTSVKIRPCHGSQEFKVSWSDTPLVSNPDVDLIVIQPNGSEYPCKEDIFWDTYVMVEPWGKLNNFCDYTFIKKATTTLVEIPEGTTPFEIETLEGVINNVAYPDYIVIGVKGELYTNTKEFFDNNLEIVN